MLWLTVFCGGGALAAAVVDPDLGAMAAGLLGLAWAIGATSAMFNFVARAVIYESPKKKKKEKPKTWTGQLKQTAAKADDLMEELQRRG